CVAIFVHSVEQARRDIALAIESGADMIELRVDRLTEAAEVWTVLDGFDVPSIVTCRPTWEGGQSELTEDRRLGLLRDVQAGDVGYVDVELTALRQSGFARGGRTEVIASSHDFQGRPDRLTNLFADLNASPADVAKIVWTARTIRDNLEAFELLLHKQKPAIALCMGEAGLISRVLARKFGAFLSFASLDASSGTASGQVPVADMKRLYRWDAIGPRTKVYGVVASPVAHSMSPAVHNAAFDATGHDGVYLPLLVNAGYESFKAFMESFLAFAPLDLAGLSVTLPHKENALRYLAEKGADVEPLAERIGAVNTIAIHRDGAALLGRNTDYAAILDSITAKLGVAREQLKDYRVAVIGAGGTGRTAVAALAHYGATVVVYNRTRDRADALAAEFNGKPGKVAATSMDKLCDSCCQIYVNTTSVGMHPHVDASPFGEAPTALSAESVVFDTVYNPPRTKLLQQAEAAGAKTIGGIEMFTRQAAAQFELWTGRSAPADVMRRVVEERLSQR
ncbi:MAG TPA: type I 3-dehydroquinate dehydratase, partial [Tepidisphaeraceae bacterium]|nr:type I 3-dehydroquinate dehydratase [Tepidisphaeraceae bacterium]